MQVNATLIAAQQAAREAQVRFQAAHVTPKPQAQASFAAALDDDIFKPLTPATPAPAASAAPASPAPAGRPGSLLDIKI